MRTSIPRLGSVTLKGGATLRVLRNTVAEQCTKVFVRDCDEIRDHRASDMAGYAVVAWGIDGGVSTIVRVRDSRQVGVTMVPDFVRSALIEHNAKN